MKGLMICNDIVMVMAMIVVVKTAPQTISKMSMALSRGNKRSLTTIIMTINIDIS